jgi:hypothetical protein
MYDSWAELKMYQPSEGEVCGDGDRRIWVINHGGPDSFEYLKRRKERKKEIRMTIMR